MSDIETCQWHGVCQVSDIPVLGARVVRRAGADDIAVFRNREDRIFAVIDRCPHKGGPLSAGLMHGSSVTCPLHNWVIDLDSGNAQAPDEGCARTVPAKVTDGMVYLGLDAEH
jgi:nitrite reductase (NADH) small subunit